MEITHSNTGHAPLPPVLVCVVCAGTLNSTIHSVRDQIGTASHPSKYFTLTPLHMKNYVQSKPGNGRQLFWASWPSSVLCMPLQVYVVYIYVYTVPEAVGGNCESE